MNFGLVFTRNSCNVESVETRRYGCRAGGAPNVMRDNDIEVTNDRLS